MSVLCARCAGCAGKGQGGGGGGGEGRRGLSICSSWSLRRKAPQWKSTGRQNELQPVTCTARCNRVKNSGGGFFQLPLSRLTELCETEPVVIVMDEVGPGERCPEPTGSGEKNLTIPASLMNWKPISCMVFKSGCPRQRRQYDQAHQPYGSVLNVLLEGLL